MHLGRIRHEFFKSASDEHEKRFDDGGRLGGGDDGDVAVLFGDSDFVTGTDLKGRNGHLVAVQGKDAVANELTGLTAGVGEAHTENNVVETAFEDDEKIGAGDALGHIGIFKVSAELLLEDAVDAADLHLLTKLESVFAELLAGAAMLAGGIGTTFLRALIGEAAVALQKQLGAFTTAEPAFGVIIFSQG